MLQLMFEWLKRSCDEMLVTKTYEGESGKGAPFIRLGPPSATANSAIMFIVDPYGDSGLNEPFVSYSDP